MRLSGVLSVFKFCHPYLSPITAQTLDVPILSLTVPPAKSQRKEVLTRFCSLIIRAYQLVKSESWSLNLDTAASKLRNEHLCRIRTRVIMEIPLPFAQNCLVFRSDDSFIGSFSSSYGALIQKSKHLIFPEDID